MSLPPCALDWSAVFLLWRFLVMLMRWDTTIAQARARLCLSHKTKSRSLDQMAICVLLMRAANALTGLHICLSLIYTSILIIWHCEKPMFDMLGPMAIFCYIFEQRMALCKFEPRIKNPQDPPLVCTRLEPKQVIATIAELCKFFRRSVCAL